MKLRLSPADLEAIYRHGEATYPEECCGLLIGRPEDDQTVVVEEIVSVENERQDSRHNRFLISPKALLDAQRSARSRQLDIVGYYHSHPDHPARPSDFDREHAWPDTSYVIVAVDQGKIADARSWRLQDDRSGYFEESLETHDGEPVVVDTPARGSVA